MSLVCRNCNRAIKDQVNGLANELFRCEKCYTIYAPVEHSDDRELVTNPGSIVVERYSSNLTITARWFKPAALVLVLFTIFWNLFTPVWFMLAIKEWMLILALWALAFFLAGLYLIYKSLGICFNKTVITADSTTLSIENSPFCFRGKRSFKQENIQELYLTARDIASSDCDGIYEPPSYFYTIMLKDINGKHITFMQPNNYRESVFFIMQQLERFGVSKK